MSLAQGTNHDVRTAYEVWRDAPQGNRRAEATAYQIAARSQDRTDEICTCGVRWRAHFPVGEAGCDCFETAEHEARGAALAAPNPQALILADALCRGRETQGRCLRAETRYVVEPEPRPANAPRFRCRYEVIDTWASGRCVVDRFWRSGEAWLRCVDLNAGRAMPKAVAA